MGLGKRMNDDARFASRKFLLAACAFVSGIPLLCAGQISSAQWVSYTTWVLGLYFGANVADTFVDRK
jgi:hypothetical protein